MSLLGFEVNICTGIIIQKELVKLFDGKVMFILSSYCEDGKKMIGMFGFGDENAEWKPIGRVMLDGDEPDWEKKIITNEKVEEEA